MEIKFKPHQTITLFDFRTQLKPEGFMRFEAKTQNDLSKVILILLLKIIIAYIILVDKLTWKIIYKIRFFYTNALHSKEFLLKNLLKKLSIGGIVISILAIIITSLPVVVAQIKSTTRIPNIPLEQKNVLSGNFILDSGTKTDNFRIIISKINIDSKIIPNVDAINEEEYTKQLKDGVAHAKGSYFPGEGGPVFLFAHSTDTIANIQQFNAQFYDLRNLEIEDEIQIIYDKKIFFYKVKDKKIINPNQLEEIRASNYPLVLSTCTPPGTNWQRLIVYSEHIKTQLL